jgi:hypothetical protein
MQRLDSDDLVGLCNDELYRRYCTWPGVYGAAGRARALRPSSDLAKRNEEEDGDDVVDESVEDEETALYHVCEAQYFHSQLPLKANMDAADKNAERTYVSKEYAALGSTEACSTFRALLKKCNESYEDEEGFFYAIQVSTGRLNGDVEIVLDEYRNILLRNEEVEEGEEKDEGEEEAAAAAVDGGGERKENFTTKSKNKQEQKEEEEDDDINDEFVRINGTINVEAIAKIWIIEREGAYGMSGKFLSVDPPKIAIDNEEE